MGPRSHGGAQARTARNGPWLLFPLDVRRFDRVHLEVRECGSCTPQGPCTAGSILVAPSGSLVVPRAMGRVEDHGTGRARCGMVRNRRAPRIPGGTFGHVATCDRIRAGYGRLHVVEGLASPPWRSSAKGGPEPRAIQPRPAPCAPTYTFSDGRGQARDPLLALLHGRTKPVVYGPETADGACRDDPRLGGPGPLPGLGRCLGSAAIGRCSHRSGRGSSLARGYPARRSIATAGLFAEDLEQYRDRRPEGTWFALVSAAAAGLRGVAGS